MHTTNKECDFPLRLSSQYFQPYAEGDQTIWYNLFVFIIQEEASKESPSISRGHFFTVIKCRQAEQRRWIVDEGVITPVEITQGDEISQMFSSSWTMLFYEKQTENYQASRQDGNDQCIPQYATFGPLVDIMNTNKLDIVTHEDLYEIAINATTAVHQNAVFVAAPTNSVSNSPATQGIYDEANHYVLAPISYEKNSPTHSLVELAKCNSCLKMMAAYACSHVECHKVICPDCTDSSAV
jgi:hypothetical protein